MASPTPDTPETNSSASRRVEFGEHPGIKFIFRHNGGAIIFVERHVLARKSEVFKKQFSSSSNENCVGEDGERISITDISFDTFHEMVQHMYGRTIDIYEGNYLELLYASKKYFVNDLTHQIIKFLEGFINKDNVDEHFEFIEKFDIKMLNDHMTKVCILAPLDLINRLTTSESHKRILEVILESPHLPCSEFQLYQAIVEMWKRDEKNLIQSGRKMRQTLGKLIYLIRFPTMTVVQLVECGKKPSLLTYKQIVELLLWVQEKIFSDTLQFYSIVPRQIK